jgi:haloalkane dehalogenase
MSTVRSARTSAISYREALPDGEQREHAVLCLHGFPETSFMWRAMLETAAHTGYRALAPDLPGSGESPPQAPNSWERLVEVVDEFADEVGLPPVVLIVHDWGGLVGLRWACEHPERVAALVISGTGFFPDGKWHGMAAGLRTEGTGEEMLAGLDRGSFGAMMKAVSPLMSEEAVDEYWRSLGTEAGRRAILEMYRSGDFEKIAGHEGELGRLGVPTLLLWGEKDEFAPVASAFRFEREIPGARIEVIEGAGHFLFSDAPDEAVAAVAGFIADL